MSLDILVLSSKSRDKRLKSIITRRSPRIVNQASTILRQCWPNPFSAEREGCSLQYYHSALYNICRCFPQIITFLYNILRFLHLETENLLIFHSAKQSLEYFNGIEKIQTTQNSSHISKQLKTTHTSQNNSKELSTAHLSTTNTTLMPFVSSFCWSGPTSHVNL